MGHILNMPKSPLFELNCASNKTQPDHAVTITNKTHWQFSSEIPLFDTNNHESQSVACIWAICSDKSLYTCSLCWTPSYAHSPHLESNCSAKIHVTHVQDNPQGMGLNLDCWQDLPFYPHLILKEVRDPSGSVRACESWLQKCWQK